MIILATIIGFVCGFGTIFFWWRHEKRMKDIYWNMIEEYKQDARFYEELSEKYRCLCKSYRQKIKELIERNR
jgi:hypothetical protein